MDTVTTPPAVRFCPTCLSVGLRTPMEHVGRYTWICPVQRDEERRISEAMRAQVAAVALRIDPALGW